MSVRKLTAGQTSVTESIFVADTASTTGAGLGSLAYNASGLVAEYRRQGQSSWTAITLAAGTLGTWSSGGWVADGSLTGAYEVGIPNAVFASGARWAVVRFRGATNMLPVQLRYELDTIDYQASGGRVPADVTYFGGSAGTFSGGRPEVNATHVNGQPTTDGGLSLLGTLRVLLAAMAGKVSGASGTSVTFRDVGDSKDRITATVDANGNRTAVTVDGA